MVLVTRGRRVVQQALPATFISLLLFVVLLLIFLYAPTESSMRDLQRILYLHVSITWCGLGGCVVMGLCSVAYLVRRQITWACWTWAAAEVSWLCVTLTLVTGSLWARNAWGVWWTWEPRLTSAFVLWLILAGAFLTRVGTEDLDLRARTSAVLAILAVCDLPIIVMATRWFRGIHPVAPQMDPRMRLVLFVAFLGFATCFAALIRYRRKQLGLATRIAVLTARADVPDSPLNRS